MRRPILVVRRFYPDVGAVADHLRMTHRAYLGDIKVIPKTKTEKRRTIKEQILEMHDQLHVDMDEWPQLPHGTVPHVHLNPGERHA